jgi:hypothetical protein
VNCINDVLGATIEQIHTESGEENQTLSQKEMRDPFIYHLTFFCDKVNGRDKTILRDKA